MASHLILLLSVGALCFGASTVSARNINITLLDNCRDLVDESPVVYITDVSYHIAEEDGLCDKVHTTIAVTTRDPSPLLLIMTLYKCEEVNMEGPCLSNPTIHEEILTCERLMSDYDGPWGMFTTVMEDEFKCGRRIGEMQLEFARLRVEHLLKYLDVYDATYNTFRLKMYFQSTSTEKVRGCGELDFTLNAL